MHELLFVHVGGAGCKIGLELWELFAREHSVGQDGLLNSGIPEKAQHDKNCIETVFDENSKGVHSARCLYIDSDPELLDSLGFSLSPYSKLYKKDNLIKGKESASSNYSRGKYWKYGEKKEEIENRLRLMLERCESPQGFLMTHSLSGGTGAGYGEALCSKIVNDMKISTSTFSVLPCSMYANEIVASYNVLLANPAIREVVDASFCYDNTSLYNICRQYGIDSPQYSDINSLIAHSISNLTSTQRFGNGKTMKSIYEHLVPFNKLNLISNHFSNFTDISLYKPSEIILPNTRMNNIDMNIGKTLSVNLSLRGPDFSLKNIIDSSCYFRSTEGSALFSKYVQTSINTSLCKTPITNKYFKFSNTVHVAHNTTAVMSTFNEIQKGYSKMYRRRAYVHWFVGEGMESGEFGMVQYNFDVLKSDYNELDENEITTKDESGD